MVADSQSNSVVSEVSRDFVHDDLQEYTGWRERHVLSRDNLPRTLEHGTSQ